MDFYNAMINVYIIGAVLAIAIGLLALFAPRKQQE